MTIREKIIRSLVRLGWFGVKAEIGKALGISDEMLDLIVRAYKMFFGVEDIESHLDAPRFCNLPDVLQLGANDCKHKTKDVTWTIVAGIPGISDKDLLDCYAKAWSQWGEVSGIKPRYIPNNRTANVLMGSRRIDGPQGTLAESELPCGNKTQCSMWFDISERFSTMSAEQGFIFLLAVACHEIGHAIGIGHIGTGNLMAPTYNPRVWKPQEGDILQARSRYGDPGPLVPPPVADEMIIKIRGGTVEIPGWRLTRMLAA